MAVVTHKNQEHPIPRKKRCTDANGNQFKRVFVTSGVSSMMLARGFKSDNAAIAFTEKVGELAEKLGANVAVNFLIKPGK